MSVFVLFAYLVWFGQFVSGSLCVPKAERFHCADEVFALEIRRHGWDIDQHSLNTFNCSDPHKYTNTESHIHLRTLSYMHRYKPTNRKMYLSSQCFWSYSSLAHTSPLPRERSSKLVLTTDLKYLLSVDLSIKLWHCSLSIDTPTGQGLKQWLWCWAMGAGGCTVISLVNQSPAPG